MASDRRLTQVRPWGGERFMRLVMALAQRLPRGLGYLIAEGVGRLLGRSVSSWRAILESNLEPVLVGASPREIRRVAVEIFAHFARSYYEMLYLPDVPDEGLVTMMTIEGPGWESFQEAQRRGQGVVLISTHQSSFDLAGQVLAARGFPSYVMALPDQPASFAFIQMLRERRGIRVLPVGPRAVRGAFRALRKGGLVVVGADRPVKDQGIEVEFFGRPTLLPDGHVRLALRTGASIFGGFCSREAGTYYLRLYPFDMVRTGDEEADIRENVQRIAHMIERPIRAHPEQWHLFRRLWP